MDDVRNPDPVEITKQHPERRTSARPTPDEAAKRRWQEENREAIEQWNAWTEEHGLLLAKYRLR